MSERWELRFVLPNCPLSQAIECNGIAIVPHDDPRLQDAPGGQCAAKRLIDSFVDQFGQEVKPSALVVLARRPDTANFYALASFRNLAAVSCIINGWTNENPTEHQGSILVKWTDYFDFYPIAAKDGQTLVGKSEATWAENTNLCDFSGQSSPHLALGSVSAGCDQYVFDEGIKLWKRHFEQGREDDRTRRLFRSLEIAFHAGRVPGIGTRTPTIHDAGVHIALWVSAMETLCHPGTNGSVNLEKVVKTLDTVEFDQRRLHARRYRIKRSGKRLQMAFVARIYSELYQARNAFMHGNPVTRACLFPFGKENAPTLLHCAPLVYRAALMAFFGYTPSQPPGESFEQKLLEAMNPILLLHSRYEDALKRCQCACQKQCHAEESR